MRTIHKEAHLIERIGWLRAAVLGANDGLIWTSSLIVGVAAATTAQHEILVAGIAGLVAGPWGIRTSSLWYAIVGNTAPAGSYAAARKSNLRWLRAPATRIAKQYQLIGPPRAGLLRFRKITPESYRKHLKRNALGGAGGRVEANPATHFAELDEAVPLGTMIGHLETPDATQPKRVKRIASGFFPIQKFIGNQ